MLTELIPALTIIHFGSAYLIRRYYLKGIYYRAKQTVFGKIRSNMDVVMEPLLTQKDDEVIGYETGAAFLHRNTLLRLIDTILEVENETA